MIKVIWFSNCILSIAKSNATGSWLYSMSDLLVKSDKVNLVNIAISPNIKTIRHIEVSDNFEEFLLPKWTLKKSGLPSAKHCLSIYDICKSISPDIIHVWGIENYFSKLVPNIDIDTKKLLEIQGLRYSCADVYYGDLTIGESLRCLGLRELLFPFIFSIYSQKAKFAKYGKRDFDVIGNYKYISTQSEWVRAQLKGGLKATIYETRMSIRKDYLKQDIWVYPDSENYSIIWCSSSLFPYKSLQTAIKALRILKDEYPTIKLYIVGNIKPTRRYLLNGYYKYIDKLIKRNDLCSNVVYTGSLYPNEMISLMKKCICSIQTSYVESYSLALAESMAIGLPSVISYAGAMPELARDKISGLFYSPGDYRTCAYNVKRLIKDRELAKRISEASYHRARLMSSDKEVLKTQLGIYKAILQRDV